MLLDPPGLTRGWPQRLPHWPYVQAVDAALTGHGIPPGTVRAGHTGREHGERMFLVLVWDVSRTAGPGGLRLHWEEETGWTYATLGANPRINSPRHPLDPLRRVFAAPKDVAEVADQLVGDWRRPSGEYGTEWDGAPDVRAAIAAFRS